MKKLRLLGFDSKMWNGEVEPNRIFLTRSRERWRVYTGESFLIFGDDWETQLGEIENRYSISKDARPFTRCAECNGLLVDVEPDKVKNVIPERIFLSVEHFKKCPDCGRIYWSGTHVKKIIEDFKGVFNIDKF